MFKDNIFGREQYLEVLQRRIRDLKEGYRQNLVIIGDEFVGKTSIIFKLLDKFYDNRIIISYIETRPESLTSFVKRFIAILLYNFLLNSDISLKEDIDFLISKSSKYLPRTVEKIRAILTALEKRKRNLIFTELFSLCDLIHQETGKFCVIIFDEFHNLQNLGIRNIYSEWSKSLILQKTTMYIIISSQKYKTKMILSKDLSLLFGNFELITVEQFDIKTSEKYLEFKLRDANLNPGIENFIIHFTGGYPFYLGLVAETLSKSGQANLVDILENLLFEPAGLLNQMFSNYIKRFLDSPYSQDYLSILYLISSAHNKLKDIANILRKSRKEINLRISQLLELDTITRGGDFLIINDRVFAFWLRFVYHERLHSLTFDAKNQKAKFRENIERMIQEFFIDLRKPFIERMTELLRLFEDEVVQIEKKRLRLTQFREIKPLEFNYRALRQGLIGRSSDSLWIIAFKYDALTEEDVTEFVNECKKYRYKLQRKIIVTFQDIDSNAKLRALQEKVLTWDLRNLNQLFELFYKPGVIV